MAAGFIPTVIGTCLAARRTSQTRERRAGDSTHRFYSSTGTRRSMTSRARSAPTRITPTNRRKIGFGTNKPANSRTPNRHGELRIPIGAFTGGVGTQRRGPKGSPSRSPEREEGETATAAKRRCPASRRRKASWKPAPRRSGSVPVSGWPPFSFPLPPLNREGNGRNAAPNNPQRLAKRLTV